MKKDSKQEMLECYKRLLDCVSFDNIENFDFICNNINVIESYKDVLPQITYQQLQNFIHTTIYPILFDEDYFSFLHREEYGEFCEKDGTFHINSMESLEAMIYLMCIHCLVLEEKIKKFAIECFLLEPSEL